MKTYIFKSLFIAFSAAGVLTSCVKDDDYKIPDFACNETPLEVTKTIKEVFDVATSTAQPYNGSDVIEGYVVSSDEGGNFFKTISFQAADGSIGFSVPVDVSNLYSEFEVGRKIKVKLEDRYIQRRDNQLQIGDLYGTNIGRLPQTIYLDVLNRSCDVVEEETLVNRVSIRDISDAHLNTLIELEDVQFKDEAVGKTFYDSDNVLGGATNHHLIDNLGYEVIFRTSEFANFAQQSVPSGSGSVRGILTKFGNDYQFLARTIEDVKLGNSRFSNDRLGIGALRNMHSGSTITLNDERFIEGVVILSGYLDGSVNKGVITSRNAIIQDETGGINIFFLSSPAQKLVEGTRVKVNLDGKRLSTFNGVLQVSDVNFDTDLTSLSVGSLPTPKVVTIAELSGNKYESQLIQINNVQFNEAMQGTTYSGNKILTDCNESIALYTRSGALFSGTNIVSGNGAFVGVATSFNGTPQLYLRNLDGVVGMNGARCQEPVAFFTEDFSGGIPANWVNTTTTGTKNWSVASFSGVFYAQQSAFVSGGSPLNLVSWLITPAINMDAQQNEYIRLKIADAFQNGNPLKLMYSVDFDGNSPGTATWNEIGSDHIADLINNSGFYDNVYETTDPIDISFLWNLSLNRMSFQVSI